MTTKIYALCDSTKQPVYVGKTLQPLERRLRSHWHEARNGKKVTPVGIWLASLTSKPLIMLLEEVQSGTWQEAERRWIVKLRTEGAALFNLHPGGNGAHSYHKGLPQEALDLLGKISDARIAEMVGLCRESITYHRTKAGIPRSNDLSRVPAPPIRPRGYKHSKRVSIPTEAIQLLGVISDQKISEQFGISRWVIKTRRHELGIARSKPVHGKAHHSTKLDESAILDILDNYVKNSNHNLQWFADKYQVDKSSVWATLQKKEALSEGFEPT